MEFKIRFSFQSFEKKKLSCFISRTIAQATALEIQTGGPIYLPTKIKKYTVLKSPHIDKKSREQFEIRTYQTTIMIYLSNNNLLDWIYYIEKSIPAGIQLKKTISYNT